MNQNFHYRSRYCYTNKNEIRTRSVTPHDKSLGSHFRQPRGLVTSGKALTLQRVWACQQSVHSQSMHFNGKEIKALWLHKTYLWTWSAMMKWVYQRHKTPSNYKQHHFHQKHLVNYTVGNTGIVSIAITGQPTTGRAWPQVTSVTLAINNKRGTAVKNDERERSQRIKLKCSKMKHFSGIIKKPSANSKTNPQGENKWGARLWTSFPKLDK